MRTETAIRFIQAAAAAAAVVAPAAAQEDAGAEARQAGAFRTFFTSEKIPPGWRISAYDHPNPGFRTAWRGEGVRFGPHGLELRLRPAAPAQAGDGAAADDEGTKAEAETPAAAAKPLPEGKDLIGGQVQHEGRHGHGRYEVVMQPARGHGLISSFYTYTGPHFGDPHHEIDIEFLGRDTTEVQLNIFVEGRPLRPAPRIDLGFDAADRPRLYGFDWLPDAVIWRIDGAEVFRLSAAEAPLPDRPGQVYMDLWGGGRFHAWWSGEAPDDAQGEAHYLCASFQPLGTETPQCSDVFGPP